VSLRLSDVVGPALAELVNRGSSAAWNEVGNCFYCAETGVSEGTMSVASVDVYSKCAMCYRCL